MKDGKNLKGGMGLTRQFISVRIFRSLYLWGLFYDFHNHDDHNPLIASDR